MLYEHGELTASKNIVFRNNVAHRAGGGGVHPTSCTFFFTLVTGPRSLSLKLSDTRVTLNPHPQPSSQHPKPPNPKPETLKPKP